MASECHNHCVSIIIPFYKRGSQPSETASGQGWSVSFKTREQQSCVVKTEAAPEGCWKHTRYRQLGDLRLQRCLESGNSGDGHYCSEAVLGQRKAGLFRQVEGTLQGRASRTEAGAPRRGRNCLLSLEGFPQSAPR